MVMVWMAWWTKVQWRVVEMAWGGADGAGWRTTMPAWPWWWPEVEKEAGERDGGARPDLGMEAALGI